MFGAVLMVYVVLVTLTVSAVREVPLDHPSDFAVEDGNNKVTDHHGLDVSSKQLFEQGADSATASLVQAASLQIVH